MAEIVRYTPRAEADFEEIWLSVAADSERAADQLIRRLVAKAELAAAMPLIGSARPEISRHARILIEGRHVPIYEPQSDGIVVIAIVHGARAPETWLS